MKYRTMIEIICDASDKDDAVNTAGEYLRGGVESGVQMSFKSEALAAHRVAKYGVTLVLALFVFSTMFISGISTSRDARKGESIEFSFPATSTMQPILKTSGEGDFRSDWELKKEEAILDYIKK